MISKKVERFRNIVSEEIERIKNPFPAELALSVMQVESNGIVGDVNTASGASGLMQVMPVTLKTYNNNHKKNKITLATLRSTDVDNAVYQIRVGLWVMRQYWKLAYEYLTTRYKVVPLSELIKIADLCYVAGPGHVFPKLEKVSPASFAAIEKRYPKFNGLPHPKNVFKYLLPQNPYFNTIEIATFLKGPILDDMEAGTPSPTSKKKTVDNIVKAKKNLVMGLLLIAAASYFMQEQIKKI